MLQNLMMPLATQKVSMHIAEIYKQNDFVLSYELFPPKTDDGLTEVPYRFCSDELAGSLPTCERWDSGVDSYEIVRNMLNDYENYWPIWGYWHDSVLFFPDLYSRRIARVFGAIQMQMQFKCNCSRECRCAWECIYPCHWTLRSNSNGITMGCQFFI